MPSAPACPRETGAGRGALAGRKGPDFDCIDAKASRGGDPTTERPIQAVLVERFACFVLAVLAVAWVVAGGSREAQP
jgi:hypothetical protein